jgi:hypothetical protein
MALLFLSESLADFCYVSVNIRSIQLVVISYSRIELSSDVLTYLTILPNQV